jgi:putative membrane protein
MIWNVLVVLVMATSLALYFRGVAHIRPARWETPAFLLGWATIAAALLSPIDTLSDVLFSVHMTQHELLMIVAAPLLVAGRPFAAVLWGMPVRARDQFAGLMRRRIVLSTWRRLTGPVTVLVLHGVVLWVWHIPRYFEAALKNDAIHAMQHLMFFITAALFWWSLIHGRYGKVGYGVAVFFVFATSMHTSILGALLTFATRLWYPMYAHRAPHPLEDQQLAGLIMWIPAGVIFMIAGLALFAAWIGESERRVRIAERERLAPLR